MHIKASFRHTQGTSKLIAYTNDPFMLNSFSGSHEGIIFYWFLYRYANNARISCSVRAVTSSSPGVIS